MRKYEFQAFICPNIYIESSTSEKFLESIPTKLLYIHLFIAFHAIPCQIHIDQNDVIYFQSFNDTYLASTLLSHLILTRMSWLPLKKGACILHLSDGNYNFDVEVEHFGLVGFLKVVIDCGYFRCWCGKALCAFCFSIKEKKKNTFNINFCSTIFLQSCFFAIHYLNWIIIINMCIQFIISFCYDELIINKSIYIYIYLKTEA